MKSIIIIPSRMDSTRFPGKPLVKILGIPMVQRVWQQALNSNVGDVYVACSEKEVYELISDLGGNAILTDPNLPSGTDRIHSAFEKINNTEKIDCIINLQGDMPFIDSIHINKVIEPIKKGYLIGSLVTDLKYDEYNNKNITKVSINWKNDSIGEAIEFFRLKKEKYKEIYHHVGIYSYSKDSLFNFVDLPKSKNEKLLNLEQCRAMDAGIKIGLNYIPDIPQSIDTKEDLISVESTIREKYEKY